VTRGVCRGLALALALALVTLGGLAVADPELLADLGRSAPAALHTRISIENGELTMDFDQPITEAEAARLFTGFLPRARQGNHVAEWRVGLHYFTGRGVKRDEVE